MKYANLFYFSYINKIGGIENWLYQLAKNQNINKYDVAIVYSAGDLEQLKRLANYVRVIKWSGERLECENLFVNFNTDIINYVTYNKLIFFAHGDYKDMVLRGQLSKQVVDNLVNKVRDADMYGVSKLVADSWRELTATMMKVCYNPIELDPPKKFIRLLSAQRMTKEKGLERIKALVNAIDKYAKNNGYIWEWDIFTNDEDKIDNPNVHYKTPTLDITSYMPVYDWFVILSDNEGYCYGAVESLLRGVPVIKTPCPVFKELKMDNSNSLTLHFDCRNVNEVAEDIFNKELKGFEYSAPASKIYDLLAKKKSKYKDEINKPVKVVATRLYEQLGVIDAELGRIPKSDEEWETNYFRAEELKERGYVK